MPIPIHYVEPIAIALAVIWLVVLPVVAWRVKVGRLFGSEPISRRFVRATLVLGYLTLLPCGYVAPRCMVRVVYGSFPLGDREDGIEPGMTAAEVHMTLGPPHEVLGPTGGDRWIYWRDSFGEEYVGVLFARDGRVESVWIP